ncbi:MAG: hypothetical protein E7040_02360 [Lentisphaerae bacterium]|nr:hypothetical protein [Lentisphaerota bacterium]
MAESKEKKIPGKKIVYPIIGVIILSALPFLIFRSVKEQEVPAKDQERFTFMTKTPRSENDQHDLEYWEKAGNPQLFAKPDSQYGYSAFLNPEMNYLRPVSSSVNTLPTLPGTFSPGEIVLHKERLPQNLLSRVKFPLIEITQKKYEYLFVNKPVFLLKGGLVLPVSDFNPPASKLKYLRPTLLEVKKPSKTAPPEITVLESCGDKQLDKAAMRAIMFPAVANDYVIGTIRVEWQQNGDAK